MRSGLWPESKASEQRAKSNTGGLLHHFGYPPPSRRKQAPPPEPVPYSIRAVTVRTVRFSLVEACKANGLLAADGGSRSAARKAWRNSDGLLDCLERKGITIASIDKLAGSLDAVIVGWEDVPKGPKHGQTSLCKDIALTIAILSRTIGGIFFADREPDYSLDNLLDRQLVIDERLPSLGTVRERKSR